MSPNLKPDKWLILSVEGDPTSVDDSKCASQTVRLGLPFQIWDVTEVGDNVYRLSIRGYPSTGIVDNQVTASDFLRQNVDWHVTYREKQDAFTIEPAYDRSKGWTVSPERSANPRILVKPLKESQPEEIRHSQLFFIKQIDE